MDNGKGAKHCSVVEAINDRFMLNEGDTLPPVINL